MDSIPQTRLPGLVTGRNVSRRYRGTTSTSVDSRPNPKGRIRRILVELNQQPTGGFVVVEGKLEALRVSDYRERTLCHVWTGDVYRRVEFALGTTGSGKNSSGGTERVDRNRTGSVTQPCANRCGLSDVFLPRLRPPISGDTGWLRALGSQGLCRAHVGRVEDSARATFGALVPAPTRHPAR